MNAFAVSLVVGIAVIFAGFLLAASGDPRPGERPTPAVARGRAAT